MYSIQVFTARTRVLNTFRPGQQSEQTPGQFLNRSLQEQVTGTQEYTGQAGELGDRKDHLQHDKMFWRLVTCTLTNTMQYCLTETHERSLATRGSVLMTSIYLA